MAYEDWERAHDDKLLESINAASFIETNGRFGDLVITFAHMRGEVTTMDGVMYWSVYGGASGERRFGQSSDAGRAAIAYGRAAVRNEITRAMDRVRAHIEARRAEA